MAENTMREDILAKRIYQKDDAGNPLEDYPGLCRRVAHGLADNAEQEEKFYHMLLNAYSLPNSPALTNVGRPGFTHSACFVLPINDSLESIYGTLGHSAIVHKMGGGTGFDFSHLRPAGSLVGTTKGVASGPVSFMAVYDSSTEAIKQGGTRRGANMGMLRVDHPDILQFIDCKTTEGTFKNFNISVAVTDEFMEALKANGHYTLTFNGTPGKKLLAREVFNKIVENAWQNGEPGILFIDVVNKFNPTPHIGRMESTNPCGEQPLLPNEACVLASINLSKMARDGKIDWDLLADVAKTTVNLLDNIIDRQSYPIKQIEEMHKANRKIGLGVMGWADMLIKLEIPYNSKEAIHLGEQVMQYITDRAVEESQAIAEKKGEFPNWKGSVWEERGIKVRNAAMTTIAPTGTLSIIAGVSSGIEPIYDFYTKSKRVDGEYDEWHPLILEWAATNDTTLHVDKEGRVKTKTNAPLPPYLVTAKEVPVEDHIRMLAAFQAHTHNAVSKTINMPNSASRDDVEKAILLAYELGCKGLTVYRDGSRKEQVLSTVRTGEGTVLKVSDMPAPKKIKLPSRRSQELQELETAEGKVFVHITMIDGRPWEVFTTTPVQGKNNEIYEGFARVLSISLRYGVPAEELLKQLEDANSKSGHISSIPAAILRTFRMLGVGAKANGDTCPECGGEMWDQSGCPVCRVCGFSKCQ